MTFPFPTFMPAVSYTSLYSATFNGSDEEMHKTFGGAGDSRLTMTMSLWFKRATSGVEEALVGASDGAGNNIERIFINSSNKLVYDTFVGGIQKANYVTTPTYADTNWHHVHVARSGATVTMSVDGAAPSFDTSTAPGASDNGMFGHTDPHYIGRKPWASSNFFEGSIDDVVYLDGVSSAVSNFYSGGKPLDPSGLSYGSNGFWLSMETSSALGQDDAQSNDFTLTNMDATNQSSGTPS